MARKRRHMNTAAIIHHLQGLLQQNVTSRFAVLLLGSPISVQIARLQMWSCWWGTLGAIQLHLLPSASPLGPSALHKSGFWLMPWSRSQPQQVVTPTPWVAESLTGKIGNDSPYMHGMGAPQWLSVPRYHKEKSFPKHYMLMTEKSHKSCWDSTRDGYRRPRGLRLMDPHL